MLRSFIRQLEMIPVSPVSRQLCNRHRVPGSEPSLDEIEDTLISLMRTLDKELFLVIDALDEYPLEDGYNRRKTLLEQINSIAKSVKADHKNVHILVTSRRELDIEQQIETLATDIVNIAPRMDNDLSLYLNEAFTENNLKRWEKGRKDQVLHFILSKEEK